MPDNIGGAGYRNIQDGVGGWRLDPQNNQWTIAGDHARVNDITVRNTGTDAQGRDLFEVNKNGVKYQANADQLRGLTIRGGNAGNVISTDHGIDGLSIHGSGGTALIGSANDVITNRSDGAYIDGHGGRDTITNLGRNATIRTHGGETVRDLTGTATIDPAIRGREVGTLINPRYDNGIGRRWPNSRPPSNRNNPRVPQPGGPRHH